MKEKVYVAKQDLPGGCPAGTKVIKGTKNLYHYENGNLCPFDCEKEPKFFAEVILPKYQIGTLVILKDQLNVNVCTAVGNKTHQMFTLPAFTDMKITGEILSRSTLHVIVHYNSRYYLVPEKNVFNAETYYYVSSKGSVHKAYVGRESQVEAYRKSIGNYHGTGEAATLYKKSLALPSLLDQYVNSSGKMIIPKKKLKSLHINS